MVEGVDGAAIRPGDVYLAPGGFHMELKREHDAATLQVHKGGPVSFARPSVDVLFRSVANAYGRGALAVIMTGMGSDGLDGCEEIKRRGGSILVQDKKTSIVWGMPGFVVEAGLADAVLPLKDISAEILKRVRRS